MIRAPTFGSIFESLNPSTFKFNSFAFRCNLKNSQNWWKWRKKNLNGKTYNFKHRSLKRPGTSFVVEYLTSISFFFSAISFTNSFLSLLSIFSSPAPDLFRLVLLLLLRDLLADLALLFYDLFLKSAWDLNEPFSLFSRVSKGFSTYGVSLAKFDFEAESCIIFKLGCSGCSREAVLPTVCGCVTKPD